MKTKTHTADGACKPNAKEAGMILREDINMKTRKADWCTCALSYENCEMHKLVRMPTKQPQRTPTPWKLGSFGLIYSMLSNGHGKEICEMVDWRNQKGDIDFLLRAVNSHEELVQMLKHLESWLRDDSFVDDAHCLQKAYEVAQVIAKATGETHVH